MSFAPSFLFLRRMPALLLLYFASGQMALAQLSATASVVSDYRMRGVSLSDGRAVPQLNLSYDNPQGWYAGTFASGATLRSVGDTEQVMAYGGYAALIEPGLSWEAGASKSVFRNGSLYNYSEVFIGLAAEKISARLSYAPNYFGKGSDSLYSEINGNYPLADTVRLTGHLGLLHARTPEWQAAIMPVWRADIRIGISIDIATWKLQVAWLATQKKHPLYLYDDGGSQHAVTVSIADDF